MRTFKLLLLLLCPLLVLLSCRNFGGNAKRDFLPGSYVNSAEGEYSIAWDTLLVEPLSDQDYQIVRKTAFQRKRDGKLLKREFLQQNWTAVFDKEFQMLQVVKSGKQIRIYPDSGMIVVGSRKYRKLK